MPGGCARRAVHVDWLYGAELEVSLENLLCESQPVRSGVQQPVALAGRPEEDVLMTELFLEEVRELSKSDLVGKKTVELLGPAWSPTSGLEILFDVDVIEVFLTVERQTV